MLPPESHIQIKTRMEPDASQKESFHTPLTELRLTFQGWENRAITRILWPHKPLTLCLGINLVSGHTCSLDFFVFSSSQCFDHSLVSL